MDTKLYEAINGLAGKAPVLDGFFKGLSNDYFTLIAVCLILVWLWFGTRDAIQRTQNQKAIITAVLGVLLANGLVALSNLFYFRERPFNVLPPESVHLLFYMPHDSSFPSDFAATTFGIAVPLYIKNQKYGSVLLAIAAVASFGRIYIGIHYPLDVLGGAAFGTVAGIIAGGIIKICDRQIKYFIYLLKKLYLS